MSTPNRDIIRLSQAGKTKTKNNRHNAAHDYYHTVSPFTIIEQKPWTLLISFLNDNICWTLQTTEAKFIYLQTATSPR